MNFAEPFSPHAKAAKDAKKQDATGGSPTGWGETPSSQPFRAQRGERSEHLLTNASFSRRCSLRSRLLRRPMGFDRISPHRLAGETPALQFLCALRVLGVRHFRFTP